MEVEERECWDKARGRLVGGGCRVELAERAYRDEGRKLLERYVALSPKKLWDAGSGLLGAEWCDISCFESSTITLHDSNFT